MLVGDGPERGRVEALAREAGIAEHVEILGELDDVRGLLSVADAFLLPSAQESFGLAALEAMACGVPVVASRVGGLPEVITDGLTGYLRDPDDHDGMAAAVLDLLDDPSLRQRVAHLARASVVDRFDEDRVVPMYEALYERLLTVPAGLPGLTAGPSAAGEPRYNRPSVASPAPRGFTSWLLQDLRDPQAASHPKTHQAPWWRVMCLTGVDYFSTLGYQPAIAFAAAGLLSPVATLVLVLLTLFGALPVYREIARLSPHGEGSVSLLQELLSRWKGKALVLCLLGFAATDYVITITLSAADATAHILENPLVPHWVEHPVIVTLVLLAALCAIFLRGFREAIGLAVLLVVVYLALNVVVIGWGLGHIVTHPELLPRWRDALFVAARQLGDDGGRLAAAVPQAGARPLGFRDRRRGHAARPGRPGRHARPTRPAAFAARAGCCWPRR